MRPGTLVTPGDRGQRGASGGDPSGAESRQMTVARGRPVVRRRDPVVAPERLGELRRLAVADPPGDLADGQRVVVQEEGGLLHADGREVLAEGRPSDLGVGALQLAARGGDAAGDVVEGEIGAELLLDDGGRVLEEAGAEADRRGSLRWHRPLYVAPPRWDDRRRRVRASWRAAACRGCSGSVLADTRDN